MTRSRMIQAVVFVSLVSLAVVSRMVEAAPNFAAVAAVALFAGFFFSSRLVAVGVPVAAMLISDCVHGFYDPRQMLVVYAMLGLPVMLRTFVAPAGRPVAWRVLGAAAYCSLAFFLVTNLAVWAFGTMYTHDLAGFLRCYAMAVPFLRFTIAGDLLYTGAIFGSYVLLTRMATRHPAPAAA
jgi:hypothetical protein